MCQLAYGGDADVVAEATGQLERLSGRVNGLVCRYFRGT